MSSICPRCGNEEPADARFCGSCGAPFVPADRQPADRASLAETTLICPSCGSEEPEGSGFCGNCGAPLAGSGPPPAPWEPAPEPTVEESPPVEPPQGSSTGRRPLQWVAAGAVVVLLVAGGVVAAFLLRSDPQPLPQPTTTLETIPPPTTPTLAESLAPSFRALTAAQDALDGRLRSLTAGVQSFAALRREAAALAASLVQTQQVADGLTPGDAADARALTLLRRALTAHLAYADALLGFPPLPRSLTEAQARAAIARAEEAQLAYAKVGFTDRTLPGVFVSTASTPRLLAVVPAPAPTPAPPSPPVRRVVDLAPVLVGIGPDDPPNEGRCFGPYTARASLTVSGVVHHSGFIQCGDDANGDPSRATGEYRFSGPDFPAGARLTRVSGTAAIDESSSPSQRGSAVTWTAFYDGTPLCSVTVVWSGSRPSPRALDCGFAPSQSSAAFDLRRLRIRQVASLASSGSLWAGLLRPTIVVEVPR